jgi:hypothetical protein
VTIDPIYDAIARGCEQVHGTARTGAH